MGDKSMTFSMITGDTYKNSKFSNPQNYAQELLNLADGIGVGHLVFLQEKQKVNGVDQNDDVFNLIESSLSSDYSFLGGEFEITSQWLNGQGKIILNANNGSNLVSYAEDGFTVLVEDASSGVYQAVEITNLVKHSTKNNRIVLTVAGGLTSADKVVVKYNSRVVNAVVDQDGNRLGEFEVQVQ